jgi:hypothetical protein
MHYLIIVNYGFVLLFGIVLTLSFADIGFKKNKKQYGIIGFAFGIVQIIAYLAFGDEFLFRYYPFLTHLPLFFLLRYYYNKNTYIAGISVLSAYLFCTPRKWVGTAISFFWTYDMRISYLTQILITIPLLIIIIKYISPYVARLKFEGNKLLRLFVLVPFLYYVLEYILTVYTDLLYQGGAVIVGFMDSAVVIIYFIFSVINLKTLYEKKEIEVEQEVLKVLVHQSGTEIEALRKSEKQTAIYRHDLRHHLNYLKACISENNLKDALSYIAETCEAIDNTKVVQYSENEPINLILSSYAAKAGEKKICSDITITATDFSKYAISDLCSLLANALENALHACEAITDSDKRFIKLRMYSKNNKLCIDIRNSYHTEPVFEQGLPVAKEPGHGFGTKSMAYVVEKYGGIYQFSAKDGVFIFQATA